MSDCCSGAGCAAAPDPAAGVLAQPRNRAERRAAARGARKAKR